MEREREICILIGGPTLFSGPTLFLGPGWARAGRDPGQAVWDPGRVGPAIWKHLNSHQMDNRQ